MGYCSLHGRHAGPVCPWCVRGYQKEGSRTERKCPICGLPIQWCKCGMGWNKFDISFDCYCVDKFQYKFSCKGNHEHNNRSLMLTKNWEDIAALWCENLVTIIEYKNACKADDTKITENETMHDYILTRLANIENCYACLFINGKMEKEDFEDFNQNQEVLLTLIGDDGRDHSKEWKDEIMFEEYINSTLNSHFFKENDIRIIKH